MPENTTHNTIYSLFKQQVEKQPDAIAVIGDRDITFAGLDSLVDRILSKFIEGDHKFIGIVMEHGIDQIAAMLAVLKSGAAYIPAEPSLPLKRREYMMRQAGVTLVIDNKFCENLPAIPDSDQYSDRSTPDGLAYILFTSGTTGRPKGVAVENHSVVNYAHAFNMEMHVGRGDVMLQYSVCSFDIFVEEVFASLLNGAAIAIPPKSIRNGSLENLMEFCWEKNVTILDGFPYLIADLNHRPELLPPSVSLIISGGDVVRHSFISNLTNRGIRIYNTYGPSETTVCSNYYRIDNAEPLDDGTYPVGKPIEGVHVRILDDNLNELKPGEIGEICISGEGVSRGYLGNPPEQANFIVGPDGARMYRSGDMGYETTDGNFVFLHRKDKQVMILGQRVEPDEVENVLNEYDGIEKGIVRAFTDEGGLNFLTAYIVPGHGFTLHGIEEFMHAKLAGFMVPEYFIALKELPVTERGKIDTGLLPKVLKEASYK